jgi:hypothetical protein
MSVSVISNDCPGQSNASQKEATLILNSGEQRRIEIMQNQDAPPSVTDQIRTLIGLTTQLNRTRDEREAMLDIQKRYLGLQAQRVARIEERRVVSMLEIADLQEKNREVIAEAEKERKRAGITWIKNGVCDLVSYLWASLQKLFQWLCCMNN